MTGALERCVGEVRRFAEEHWGRRPLLRRGDGERGFAELLAFPDVDHLVTGTLLRVPALRLVKDGTPLDPSTYTQTVRIGGARVDRTVRPDRVAEAFADGATIVLQALHRQWPPVAGFCRDLELALTHPVQANAYVTPATARGFDVHHDTHDVFVLQTHGHKEWRVYRPVVDLAVPEQPWSRARRDPGDAILEAELAPGDALYIPRGFPHDAAARREVSIHVTVGILAHTWLDLWRDVMKRAADHLPFRESLPIGYAGDPGRLAEELPGRLKELVTWLEEAADEGAAGRFARRFWSTRRPVVPGQLQQVQRLESIGPGTRLRRREGAVFEVSSVGDEIAVLLGSRELRMPAFVEPDVVYVARAAGPFTAGDLPGPLDRGSRLVLLRRLVKEGGVEVLDAGA